MDKNAIKKYAVWARRELISRVSQKALQYGISEKNTGDANADTINGQLLTSAEQKQRQALVAKIKKDGYQQVMEEVAYTWFNRFCALRYMEVNGYLPTRVRVFTDEQNNFKPQIIAEAIHLELSGLDMEKVYALKEANQIDELYKYLLITQCNALSDILPGLFQKIADYTELLFPDNLLREGSAIEQMIALIPEEDWTDQVQIIGWLYQYYNAEIFDSIFDGDMSRKKVTKNLLPAATQLFTPDWAIQYMVQNSLGRLWLEGHPDEKLKCQWKYYLEESEQEPEVQAKLTVICKEYANLNPEDIKCIDPCQGSGHILVVLFDVLVQIYEAYGYSAREAATMIVEHNIYGLDIDERAAQLSYFAVMMKARQYDRRFFSRKVQPHVYAIVESNDIDEFTLEYFVNGDAKLKKSMDILMDELRDAKEYGSIINVTMVDFSALYARLTEVEEDISMHRESALNTIKPLVQVAETLAQKYNVTCTNPPYLGNSRMNDALSAYIKKYYPDEKNDLAMAMLNKMMWSLTMKNGYTASITTASWMFLKSFEKFRKKVLAFSDFTTLVDFGTELFDGKIGHLPIVSWVSRNSQLKTSMLAVRLVEYCYSRRNEKETNYFNKTNHFVANQANFSEISGSPIAYWASSQVLSAFEKGQLIDNVATVKIGMGTGKNEIFLRSWWEINFDAIDFSMDCIEHIEKSTKKFFPYNKGGEYRRWYGNLQDVVWYDAAGRKKMFSTSGHRENGGRDAYFKPGITWNFIGATKFGVRLMPAGCLFDVAGSSLFVTPDKINYIMGYLSSSVCNEILKLLNPTVNYQAGNIKSLPVLFKRKKEVDDIVDDNIQISMRDWNDYETSWDYSSNPLVSGRKLSDAYIIWKLKCEKAFQHLKNNEEKLNGIFIDIYNLHDELTPGVADKDVTVHRIFDTKDEVPEEMRTSNYVRTMRDEVVSLISYAVGCMFGRYSLDVEGLAYAGGEWDASKYQTFMPDKDNIIPICDDDYFDDDIMGRFIKWVETVYGADTLEENLKFIADALGGKGSAREVIRNYFISDFYADHLKTYQKRPIYWLFDSGKKGGFKALIYMHRYRPDTIARIRTDYVHEQQSRYRTAIADLQQRMGGASTGDRVKLTKQLNKLEAQAEEIRTYEEKIHHLADQMIPIDLDDGVKVNYAKFADVLAKIK